MAVHQALLREIGVHRRRAARRSAPRNNACRGIRRERTLIEQKVRKALAHEMGVHAGAARIIGIGTRPGADISRRVKTRWWLPERTASSASWRKRFDRGAQGARLRRLLASARSNVQSRSDDIALRNDS